MPENNKITKNSFSGGRNTDVNVAVLQPDQYTSAHNVDFIANGNFFALQNLQGTTYLQQIGNDPTIREIGSAPCKFTINGVLTYCIVYFTMSSANGTYNIWMFDTQSHAIYALYRELYLPGYYTDDRVVDIVNYPENGVDHIYFTDGFNELRHITCAITTPWTANSLSAYDIALQRRGANGIIALNSVTDGGSLLSGTYQFAYRMANPATKKFTKWSYITNPVHVYSGNNVNGQVFAGIGLQTTRQILLEVHPSQDELDAVASGTLPYIQLAVIENIASTPPTTVSFQQYVLYVPGPLIQLNYQSNTRVASQSLDSFVIDPAQILAAKTLRTTNNRLFLGNIDYINLKFDSPFGNGIPAVTTGTIISRQSTTVGQGDSYTSDTFSSEYIGYFRDEVYRFGVVYKDKYGNRSYVSPLNMNSVTDNQSTQTGGVRDMKFPKRSFDKKYTLFNSNGAMQGLGLQLRLVNHPTWAVEMEVVRVPRIKNILFQSPLIPMMTVNGTGALGDYPSKFSIANQGQIAYPNAQPMTADKILVPKNMFWPEGRDIIYGLLSGDFPGCSFVRNEVIMDNGGQSCSYNFSMVFPQANMYEDTLPGANGLTNSFIYTGVEKIDFVDQALLKLNYYTYINNPAFFNTKAIPYVLGEDIDTNTTGNFYAVADQYYLFDSNFTTGKNFPNATNYNGTSITGYQFYDNSGVTAPVSGQSVMDYPALATKGFVYGFEPDIQRSAVISLNFAGGNVKDPTFTGADFAAGHLNAYGSGGGTIMSSGGAKYEPKTALTCGYLSDFGTYSLPNDAPCTAVDVVNVKLGLEDNRYGDINALHTFQSTAGISQTPVAPSQSNTAGIHTFSSSEQSDLRNGLQVTVDLMVWGGDCFVSPHTFKICDGTYSITNSRKAQLSGSPPLPNGTSTNVAETHKWGGFYFNGSGSGSNTTDNTRIACLPIGVKNAAQFITVVLESEYNGGVRDHEIITAATSSNGVPILNSQTIATCRTPLSYRYNFNISRGNYQKVFTTLLQFSFQQFSYDSRVAWSNIKIYNSDVSGFDTFNVSDFYDLPEQRYAITSLAVAADMLYALQERGVVYLPTSGRQIEQADSSTLAVVSDVVIGRPVVVSTERGTQHLRSVSEIGDMIFMTDNKNKEFYLLAGTELNLITKNQQTEMKRIWTSLFPGNAVKSVYDFVNEQWLTIMPPPSIGEPGHIQVYDHARNVWVGDYEGLVGKPVAHGGTYQKGTVYMTAFDGGLDLLSIYSLYTGPTNVLFGNNVDPRVTFVVNPDEAFSKTFDVFLIDSSDQLNTADLQVVYDSVSSPSTITGLNLAVPNVENNYRVPLGKDQNGYRLRGMRMLVTAHWKSFQGDVKAQLKSIFTKYRYSKRTPF